MANAYLSDTWIKEELYIELKVRRATKKYLWLKVFGDGCDVEVSAKSPDIDCDDGQGV